MQLPAGVIQAASGRRAGLTNNVINRSAINGLPPFCRIFHWHCPDWSPPLSSAPQHKEKKKIVQSELNTDASQFLRRHGGPEVSFQLQSHQLINSLFLCRCLVLLRCAVRDVALWSQTSPCVKGRSITGLKENN